MLAQINVETSVIYVLVTFFILGLGIGVLFGTDNLIVQESVDKEHAGIGLATVQLFQSLGTTLGFSIFGSLLSGRISSGIASLSDNLPAETRESLGNGSIPHGLPADLILNVKTVFANSFQSIFAISIGFAVLTFIICLFMKKEVLSPQSEAPQSKSPSSAGVNA
ncbi:hypothetical protein [Paenibacillus sp. J22TS3]|nr:hypothetical protein [Paenibacillus sp. J22TS3]GIP21977.1 hypothetical protein J22TS3_22520 [Paenibacillus sp. J22TS3]